MSVGDMVEFIYEDFGVGIILKITTSMYSKMPIALIVFPRDSRPVWLDMRDLNKVEEIV